MARALTQVERPIKLEPAGEFSGSGSGATLTLVEGPNGDFILK